MARSEKIVTISLDTDGKIEWITSPRDVQVHYHQAKDRQWTVTINDENVGIEGSVVVSASTSYDAVQKVIRWIKDEQAVHNVGLQAHAKVDW